AFRKNKIFCERFSIINYKMKYLAILTVLLIFKVHEINATSVTIPGYTYWIKCLTTDQTKSSTQISYDITSKNITNVLQYIAITYSGTTPSTYSAPTSIDMSGFGYKYSYLQHVSILDAVLSSYSGPTFTVSNSATPVDFGGFFAYLLDNSRSPTADPLCGSTTSFVGSCTQQKTDLNSDWCLLIGNFFVSQSVNFDISYQTYDVLGNPSTTSSPNSSPSSSSSSNNSPLNSTTSTSSSTSKTTSTSSSTSTGMSKIIETNIITSSICGILVWLIFMFCV
ncbi:6889_t:CDS:2, partial [Dentiscutata erythropus]